MLISSELGAGQIVSARDDTRFYDDIACLAADYRAGDIAYVRVGNGWREVTAASFARPQNARTAMGSGYVAFATAAEARTADPDRPALAWSDVLGAAAPAAPKPSAKAGDGR